MFIIYAEYLDPSKKEKIMIFNSNIENQTVLFLKLDMILNESGTLEMTILKDNPYNRMDPAYNKIIRVFKNNKEIWRGFETKIKTDFYLNKYVLFEGAFSFFKYIVGQYPSKMKENYYSYTEKDLITYFFNSSFPKYSNNKLIPRNINFLDGSRPDLNNLLEEYISFNEGLDNLFETFENVLKNRILNKWGGYIVPKFYSDSDYYDLNIFGEHSLEYYSTAIPERMFYKGKNVLDFSIEIDNSNVYTGALPIGYNGFLIKGENYPVKDNVQMNDDPDYGKDDIIKQFGERVRIIVVNPEGDYEINDPGQLKSASKWFLSSKDDCYINIKIDIFDENVLKDNDLIILPGEQFTYQYFDSKISYPNPFNVLCNEVIIDFLNLEKSIWKSGVDNKISGYTDEDFEQMALNYYIDFNNGEYYIT